MAKILWLYSRSKLSKTLNSKLREICLEISPDNILCNQPKIDISDHLAYAIMNPTRTLLVNEYSVLMGKITSNNNKWQIPGAKYPDGSFALFRHGIKYIEVVSDCVASRSIWYFFNEQLFIASTSQRAIILFLGSFEFDERVIPWMLSTGSIGPMLSWDSRIKLIPPDSSVTLNKQDWTLRIKSIKIRFKANAKNGSRVKYEDKLKNTLQKSFESLKICSKDWVLPLSGGYDSRGILCLLQLENQNQSIKTVTWGLRSSLRMKNNDAYIAKHLARMFNVDHQYLHTDPSKEPVDKILKRFILNGEGRIDHISGYSDGFNIWKKLFEEDIQGVIRGDEGFGWVSVSSPLDVRMSVGLGLCNDYKNLREFCEYDLSLPSYLDRIEGESLSTWRDRLYHEYRFPTILAALSDLKLSYMEVANPLLSRSILQIIRMMPDKLRTNKRIFKKIVKSMSPKIKYATHGANASPKNILKQKEIVDLFHIELSSECAKSLFSEDFLFKVLKNIEVTEEKKIYNVLFSPKLILRRIIPSRIKSLIREVIPSLIYLDYNILAFRIFIIIKMYKVLSHSKYN